VIVMGCREGEIQEGNGEIWKNPWWIMVVISTNCENYFETLQRSIH